MIAAVIGLGVLTLLAFLVFDRMVYRFGALGALIVLFGILLIFTYITDRRAQRRYDAE